MIVPVPTNHLVPGHLDHVVPPPRIERALIKPTVLPRHSLSVHIDYQERHIAMSMAMGRLPLEVAYSAE